MANKKYFWLKLKNTYFNQLTQKKMRRQPNGKEMQIIYLRMLLLSVDKDGYIHYQGVYDSIEEELSEEFDEPQEIVKQTIDFLLDNNMASVDSESSLYMPEAVENIGKETDSAKRMRRKRARDEETASQCDGNVTSSDGNVTECDTEKRRTEQKRADLNLKSKKTETLDLKSKTETETEHADADSIPAERLAGAATASAARQTADLFSVSRLLDIVASNKVNLTKEGVWAYFDEMQESGWVLYGKKVEKKGIIKALRGWAKYHSEYNFKWSDDVEDNILRLLEYYASNALFDEREDAEALVAEYCPREIFTKEQLEFMEDEWQVRPRPKKSVKIDPVLEKEREMF